jgi:GntR family phosphonate transport system transcriptional regulator
MARRDVYTSEVLNRTNGDRIYRQLARVLGEEIRSRFRPGDALPAELVLAQRFGVNRHTLRRAVEVLMAEGLVERRHGLGTFVMNAPLRYPLRSNTRFSTTLEAQGRWPDSRTLSKSQVASTSGVARRLGLKVGAQVYHLEILRLMNGRPVSLSSHFLVPQLVPDLLRRYEGGSLHACLETAYGLKLRRIESLVTAVLPLGDDARLLEMPRDKPVLRVKSQNVHARTRVPVEYVLSRFRADCIALQVNPGREERTTPARGRR